MEFYIIAVFNARSTSVDTIVSITSYCMDGCTSLGLLITDGAQTFSTIKMGPPEVS